jgi:hypothetical protein
MLKTRPPVPLILYLLTTSLQLPTDERTRQLRLELVELTRTIPQPMIIRDIMEELLRIECTPKQQRKITIGSLDDIRDLVHRFPAVKSIFVRQSILQSVGGWDAFAEGFCYAG